MLKTLSKERVAETLSAHQRWVHGDPSGTRADLSGANLSGANLSRANLSGANLSRANLSRANLSRADLSGANLSGAYLPDFAVCPDEGAFVAFKKLQGSIVATLEIPAEARRTSSLVGRKCRAEFARVLALSGGALVGYSQHDGKFAYRLGEVVHPDSFDGDIRAECLPGIHFFITKKEAEKY